jgi:ATP-binding protein involved in chromosome partitioning
VGYLTEVDERASSGPDVPWLEDLEEARARVAEAVSDIRCVLAVMSGKGGVGKSVVAVNLAVALAQRGLRVGILDADLQGPSVPKMLGLRGQPIRLHTDGRMRPVPGPAGLVVQSMDFFLQGSEPLEWEGPVAEGAPLRSAMEAAALADLLGRTDWGALDVLVVDLPPGADRLPELASWLPRRLQALAVAIPTEVALLAVERSLRRAQGARVPLVGLVENCASAVCSACGNEDPLYGEASVEPLLRDLGIERVARLPFDPALAAAADAGSLYLEGPGRASAAGRAFAALAQRIATLHHDVREADSW